MDAPIREPELGARDQVDHRAGHEHLAGGRLGRDPRTDVDGDAADAAAVELDLARVHAGADLQPERGDRGMIAARAAHGLGGLLEGGEEAVAGRVDLAAPEPAQLAADCGMVPGDEVAPRSVAERAPPARSIPRCR